MNGSHAKADKTTVFKACVSLNGPVLSGYNVVAAKDISRDERVVSCPFSLAITPQVARRGISAVLALETSSPALTQWSERQLICTYLSLHRALDTARSPPELMHGPYVSILPAPHKLCTPLHFTGAELALFRGTNLYGATLDRQRAWEAEWEDCRDVLEAHNSDVADRFTWAEYLTASTYLSSRAFPSTLLSENPSLVSTPSSYPVLLPGVDNLNHARAQPVSWVVTHPSSSTSYTHVPAPPLTPTISLVLHTSTAAGNELFNNYGPKPNAELILGYGFALPHNPDDTIVLKIGSANADDAGIESKWEVGRQARGVEPVWEAVKAAVRAQNQYEAGADADGAEGTDVANPYEEELWATEVLADMAEDLMSRLPSNSQRRDASVRPEVLQMLDYYIEGQRDILNSLMNFAKEMEQNVIQQAQERGIAIVDDSS
ncbi:hypothetical protein EIP86_002557 [Pleurotus ostreatoroseus]|nr:hypothetical protein EIP86_002557 [Pleurotus ostreatoroseus]